MNRKDFPFLDKNTFLDSAAGTLKPIQVVDAIKEFYLEYPINPHSPDSALGVKVLNKVNETRDLVAELIGASSNEVIFTSGTTDSLNKVAAMFRSFLKENDEILLSKFNHASNVIPWMEAAKATGAKVILSNNIYNDITEKTKVVSYASLNNTIQENFSPNQLYKRVKKNGAVLVNDAAQAIAQTEVSLHDADVVVFSGNKIYGPTGIGVMAIRKELLSTLNPSTYGGGANATITAEGWTVKEGVQAFEAGTLNTAGIIGLGAGIKFFNEYYNEDEQQEVAKYAYEQIGNIENVQIFSKDGDKIIIFNVGSSSPQDVVSYLGHKNILLRAGKHCVKSSYLIPTIRMSFGIYSTKEDVDKAVELIKNGGDFLDFI